ncbi:hypothetical protein BKA80DRAFT_270565 [Phyllosticta citrichinensis]
MEKQGSDRRLVVSRLNCAPRQRGRRRECPWEAQQRWYVVVGRHLGSGPSLSGASMRLGVGTVMQDH